MSQAGEPSENSCIRCGRDLIHGQVGSMEPLAFFAKAKGFLSRGVGLPLEAWCCRGCGTVELRVSDRTKLEGLKDAGSGEERGR